MTPDRFVQPADGVVITKLREGEDEEDLALSFRARLVMLGQRPNPEAGGRFGEGTGGGGREKGAGRAATVKAEAVALDKQEAVSVNTMIVDRATQLRNEMRESLTGATRENFEHLERTGDPMESNDALKFVVGAQLAPVFDQKHSEQELDALIAEVSTLGPGELESYGMPTRGGELAAHLVASWTAVAMNNNLVVAELQAAVARHLDVTGAATTPPVSTQGAYTHWLEEGRHIPLSPALRGALDTFVAETYAQTQAMFKTAGVTHVTVYRGMAIQPPFGGKLSREQKVLTKGDRLGETQLRPLSSFTTDYERARLYAEGDPEDSQDEDLHPVIVGMRVPVDRVFSTTLTGPGSHREREVIVLGGTYPAFSGIAGAPEEDEYGELRRTMPSEDDFHARLAAKVAGSKKKKAPRG